jgi:nitronate monooxygenase
MGHAMDGDMHKGLFFRGAGQLPFGQAIRPVRDLLKWMLAGVKPPVLA